jgi:hypothetical protein
LRSDRWRPVEFSQRACRSRSGLPRSYRTPWARNSCRGRAAGVSSSCLFCSARCGLVVSRCLHVPQMEWGTPGLTGRNRTTGEVVEGRASEAGSGLWLHANTQLVHAIAETNCRLRLQGSGRKARPRHFSPPAARLLAPVVVCHLCGAVEEPRNKPCILENVTCMHANNLHLRYYNPNPAVLQVWDYLIQFVAA